MKRVRPIHGVLWNVPVGLQLSLLYALLFACILSLLGAVLYVRLDLSMEQDAAARLRKDAAPLLQRVESPPAPRKGPKGPSPVPDPKKSAADLVRGLSGPGVTVAIMDRQGQTLDSSQSLTEANPLTLPDLPAGWLDQVAAGTASAQKVLYDPDGIRRLVVVLPFRLPATNGVTATVLLLVQAASLASADAILNQLRLYLILGVIGGTLIGVLAGLALTRVVLQPLERMAGTAGAITAGDLSRRLQLPPGTNEIARLGASFDTMVDRLAAMMEAQRRFIADASHELRTPLTSLEGLAEMLLTGADRGDAQVAQRMARAMHGEMRRLSRLVSDLLTLSRLDSAPALVRTPVDIGKILVEVVELMTPLAEARRVHLTVQRSQPVITPADPDQLTQVVVNLVDNALRYSPPDGEVRMTCAPGPARGNVRFDVQDTGPGILPVDLPHIFDRFYRGDPSRSRASGSSGLGLAIARAIVEAHGGSISVSSPPGTGSCFTVVLPADAGILGA